MKNCGKKKGENFFLSLNKSWIELKKDVKNDLENVLETFFYGEKVHGENFQRKKNFEVKSGKSSRDLWVLHSFFYENVQIAPTKMTEFLKLYGFKKKNWRIITSVGNTFDAKLPLHIESGIHKIMVWVWFEFQFLSPHAQFSFMSIVSSSSSF